MGWGCLGSGRAPAWEASQPDSRPPAPSSGLRPSFAVLLLLSATWLLALLSVNSDTLLFHYLFAASNCVQVLARPMPCGRPLELCMGGAGLGGTLISTYSCCFLPVRAPSSSSPTWCLARRSGKHSSLPAAAGPALTLL